MIPGYTFQATDPKKASGIHVFSPYVLAGIVYAVSDTVYGPYRFLRNDNTLLGGRTGHCGFSARSICFGGKRYILYTGTDDKFSYVSPPFEAIALPDQRLRLAYNERLKKYRKDCILDHETPEIYSLPYTHGSGGTPAGRWKLEDGFYYGESRTGWQIARFDTGTSDMEINAKITLESGVGTGIVFSPDYTLAYAGGDIVVAFDAEEKCLIISSLDFSRAERFEFNVEYNREYDVKILIRQPRYEAFVDNILVGNTSCRSNNITNPGFGLYVEKGKTKVHDLSVFSLGADIYLEKDYA